MSRISFEQIRELARDVLSRSPLASEVRDVEVELADDLNDDTLLWLIVTFADTRRVDVDQAIAVQRALQDAVIGADDRFPVVQFADAA